MTCRVVSRHAADTEPKQSITLFMAPPKGDKMEFIVQKAVELGVSRIVPYLSKNCVSRPDKTEKKVERYGKIAAEAPAVSGRSDRLPEVANLPYRSLRQSRRRRKAKRHCFSTKKRETDRSA